MRPDIILSAYLLKMLLGRFKQLRFNFIQDIFRLTVVCVKKVYLFSSALPQSSRTEIFFNAPPLLQQIHKSVLKKSSFDKRVR